ncbi:MAG: undecaprenyl-phosphate glucose phosphotransferase [Bacteroidetes bacterium]|nr:undecaprenyl-phosphate glucose phosphotransferase [Bacteroidota bacterium]MBS1539928.1 undecaprenyl-phosphate glucose phosphotransferase [Bacteroidota bacterium]
MQESIFERTIKLVVFLGDLFFLNMLLIVLYFRGHFIIHPIDLPWFIFLALTNISWLVVLFYTNPYKIFRMAKTGAVMRDIFFAVFQHFLITSTLLYLFEFEQVHFWSLASVYSVFLMAVLIWRLAFIVFLRNQFVRGYHVQQVAVLGYGYLAIQLQRYFNQHPEYGYCVSGFFDPYQKTEKKVGDMQAFYRHVADNQIGEVFCCVPDVSHVQVKEVINWCEDKFIKVKVLNEFRAFTLKGIELEQYDNIPVLRVTALPLDDKRYQLLKRIFDVLFSVIFFITIGWWLFALIAILIKLNSQGPVFFKQKRAGQNNTPFTCYKFRTMHVNDQADSVQATKHDPRVTRIGAFLRKTSLDELPQFINVIAGDMSVVGPRPHPLLLNERFVSRINKFMVRHSVKPGITGLAQVKGYRGETQLLHDMKGRFRFDVFYIENWSFVFDLKIIFKTVVNILDGSEKAY